MDPIPSDIEQLLRCFRCDKPIAGSAVVMKIKGNGLTIYHKDCPERRKEPRSQNGRNA
jgi:(p)ppGpp synthase/HD superfamily hydrolase